MNDRQAPALLTFALVLDVCVVVGLRHVGPTVPIDWTHPARWLAATATEDVVVALGRMLGLGAGYWFLTSTLLYLAARLSRKARAIQITGVFATPGLRRLVDRALAGVLVTGLMSSPALATGGIPSDYLPFDTPIVRAATEHPEENGWDEVEVVTGDNLWRISQRRLDELGSEDAIAPYWREVVDVNRPHLRSGDPDLIYPGEVIKLPPPGDVTLEGS